MSWSVGTDFNIPSGFTVGTDFTIVTSNVTKATAAIVCQSLINVTFNIINYANVTSTSTLNAVAAVGIASNVAINCHSLITANAITFNNIANIRAVAITEARYNYANYISISYVSAIGTLSNHLGNIKSASKINIYYTEPLPDPVWTNVKGTYEIRYN